MRVCELIGWNRIEGLLSTIYHPDWNLGGGRAPYLAVQILSVVLLSYWCQLSDQGLVDTYFTDVARFNAVYRLRTWHAAA